MTNFNFEKTIPFLTKTAEFGNENMLKLVHHNTEGLLSHIDDVKSHHEFHCADLICLTETFHCESSSPLLSIPNYTLLNRNRSTCYTTDNEISSLAGGGVAIYVRDTLEVELLSPFQNVANVEYVAIKVLKPYTAIIITIYRPPRYSITDSVRNIACLLQHIDTHCSIPIVVTGDLNEDQLSDRNKPLLNLFMGYGYQQIIASPTTAKRTLLDVVFIREHDVPHLKSAGIVQTYHSYHDAVFCILQIRNMTS